MSETLASQRQKNSPIEKRDIIASIIESLASGALTEAQLLRYFVDNATLLRNNIHQAKVKYGKDSIEEIVNIHFPQYLANKSAILSNLERFETARNQVDKKIREAFENEIPNVILVPCIGLFAPGGWADNIDGTYHIFVALERLPENFAIEVLLAHEIAHGISEIDRSTVLGGFYNEGFATYISSVLYPGQPEEAYFFSMDRALYEKYLEWIDKHRDKIWEDSGKPFEVLDDTHKFYFTTSFSDYPNIGYVIGFKYLEHLNNNYTLKDLRTFGLKDAQHRGTFKAFIFNAPLD